MKEKQIKEAMDTDFIKDQLFYLAENLRALAEKITDNGGPLTDGQRHLVRFALSSHWLDEVFSEVKINFVSGNKEYFDKNLEYVQRIFDSLT